MAIDVESHDWGDARPIDIKAVLDDAASHLNQLVDEPIMDQILVVAAHGEDARPMTHYRRSPEDPIIIRSRTGGMECRPPPSGLPRDAGRVLGRLAAPGQARRQAIRLPCDGSHPLTTAGRWDVQKRPEH